MNKFFFLLLFFISCSEKQKFDLPDLLSGEYPLLFDTSQKIFLQNNINIIMQLRVNTKGDTLLCAALIENQTLNPIKINPYNLQITTSKNTRFDIVWSNLQQHTIKAKSVDTLLFKFSPINNLNLYKKTDYKGDLDSIYYLTPSFIDNTNFDEIIKFSLSTSLYQKYKKNYSKENSIKTFKIKDSELLKNELSSTIKVINSIKKENKSNDASLLNNTITIEGYSIELNFYNLDSNLYLNAKFINHGKDFLKLDPSKFIIKIKNKFISPQIVSVLNSVSSIDNNYYLVKGGRLEMKLKYNNVISNEFSLLNDGINFVTGNDVFFPKPLQFIIETLPVKE